MDDLLQALPGPWKTAVILFMVGVRAGPGGSIWRVDKFTGSEGRELADRISELEEAKNDWGIWRTLITGQMEAIRNDDRHMLQELQELKGQCGSHTTESEEWKRRIQVNEQSIENLWKWYQRQNP